MEWLVCVSFWFGGKFKGIWVTCCLTTFALPLNELVIREKITVGRRGQTMIIKSHFKCFHLTAGKSDPTFICLVSWCLYCIQLERYDLVNIRKQTCLKKKMKVYHIKQIGCDFIAMICSLLQKYLTWKTTYEHFIPETLKT